MAKIDASQLNLEDKVLSIKRVSAVIKGGRRFSIQALVVVGDYNGHVGFGLGKDKEYSDAIRKATESAKRNIVEVPTVGSTIPYIVRTNFGASEVLLKPAALGTGIIAGTTLRSILELIGIRDILTKSLGSTNKGNTVQACFRALKELRQAESVAQTRGKTLTSIVGRQRAAYFVSTDRQQAMEDRQARASNEKTNKGKNTELLSRKRTYNKGTVPRS